MTTRPLSRSLLTLVTIIGHMLMMPLAYAGEASVLDATVIANAKGTYAVSATIFHKDEGWTHYADKFDIMTPTGKLIATRVLYHPHVDEQPFTRSVANVQVPVGVTEIIIRAHDSKHGDGERIFKLKLPKRK